MANVNKPDRDKGAVTQVCKVALECATDTTIELIDRITRLRAARTLADDAGLVSVVKEIDTKLEEVG